MNEYEQQTAEVTGQFQPDMTEPPLPADHTEERKAAKKAYSRIGLVIALVFLGIAILTSVAAVVLRAAGLVNEETANSVNFQLLIGTMPIAVIGYPLMYLFLRKLPAQKPGNDGFKARHEIMFLIMTISAMYIGNIISSLLIGIFSSGQSTNQVADIITAQQILPTIYFVLIAPIGEELIFRKVIIDRVGCYGQKWAILFSTILYSLFHMNFYQLLYTFLFGLILGYVYSKSGKIINTIIIHVTVNFLGSFVAPLVLSLLDQEKLTQLSELSSAGKEIPQELLTAVIPGLLVYLSYMALYMGLVIAGIVLFIINVKKLHTKPSEILPTAKTALPAMLCNAGVIIYIVLAGIFTILTFVSSFIQSAA